MKIDLEKISKEINRIRHKGTLSYDNDSEEVTGPGDISHLPPITQGIIENKKKDLEGGWGSEPTETEQELAEEKRKRWDTFENKVLKVVEVFTREQDEEFFYFFIQLVESLNRLWDTAFFDMEAQICIFKFLEDADQKKYANVKDQLWFCMFDFSEDSTAMELAQYIISNDISPNFPFPGFYYRTMDPKGEE